MSGIEKLVLSPELSIIDAVAKLEDAHRRVVLVVNDDGVLLGLVTDQDIRRAVLAGIDFSLPVMNIATRHPIVAPPSASDAEILNLMRNKHCYQIPIVDHHYRLHGIRFLEDLIQSDKREPQVAVVMAGGFGSRLKPLTDNTPKSLIEVGGQPILFTILDQLLVAGFERIWITLNYLGPMIREAVGRLPKYAPHVRFVEELARLGTAGSLSLIPERPAGSFLVMNGDLLTTVSFGGMMEFHRYETNAVTMAAKQEIFTIPYGVAELEGTRVKHLREKPSMSFFLNAGIYVVEPDVLTLVEPGKPLDMPDLIEGLVADGRRVGCFPVHEYWLDVGVPEQLERANSDYIEVFGSLPLRSQAR
jgi:dTDP-glucose pyrophosphorylase